MVDLSVERRFCQFCLQQEVLVVLLQISLVLGLIFDVQCAKSGRFKLFPVLKVFKPQKLLFCLLSFFRSLPLRCDVALPFTGVLFSVGLDLGQPVTLRCAKLLDLLPSLLVNLRLFFMLKLHKVDV